MKYEVNIRYLSDLTTLATVCYWWLFLIFAMGAAQGGEHKVEYEVKIISPLIPDYLH